MYRFAYEWLTAWSDRPSRKPLIVRGARQVGKSFLVRTFAQDRFDHLLEIDFEREPEAASLFESKAPATILPLLEARFGVRLEPGAGLLFLDEIQAAPQVFSALRYFSIRFSNRIRSGESGSRSSTIRHWATACAYFRSSS